MPVPADRSSSMLKTACLVLWCFAVAVVGGAASVWYVLQRQDFDVLSVGPWTAQPDGGFLRSDPYSRARVAVGEMLALSRGEGVVFTALRDSSGDRLRGECRYRIAGSLPPARVWTLHAAPRTAGLNSYTALFSPGGGIDVVAGRRPEPGNWLPTGDEARPVFTLTLYDADLAADTATKEIPLPSIGLLACDA